MKISGAVLTYNSEFWVKGSAGCLRPIVDELIVGVDDMTTDRTVEVAKELGADDVFTFQWIHDYGYAKNLLLDHCTGDWVILLDDDEKLSPEGALKLKDLILRIEKGNLPYDAIQLGQKNHYPEWTTDEDDYIKEFYPNSHVQIFKRNIPGHRYTRHIHEGITLDMSRLFPFDRTEELGIMLHHHAWKGDRAKWEAPKHFYYKDLMEGKKFQPGEKPF